jgi:hypothetical protein
MIVNEITRMCGQREKIDEKITRKMEKISTKPELSGFPPKIQPYIEEASIQLFDAKVIEPASTGRMISDFKFPGWREKVGSTAGM